MHFKIDRERLSFSLEITNIDITPLSLTLCKPALFSHLLIKMDHKLDKIDVWLYF